MRKVKMKSTKWQKPIGDCGGINELIKREIIRIMSPEHYMDVIVHAYREVGTSLEAAVEIHWYHYDCSGKYPRKKIYELTLTTWRF